MNKVQQYLKNNGPWIWICLWLVGIFLYYAGLYSWWFCLDTASQAAWVQAIGVIIAIFVAVLVPYWQRWSEQESKKSTERKIVMSAAANLSVALDYAAIRLDFAPAGDGVIGHEFNLEQAREFMKLGAETHDALKIAIDKSHYFDERLCEQIVLLSINAAAYERIIDENARLLSGGNVNTFFKTAQGTKSKISERLNKVRMLLKAYLPQDS